MSLEAFRTSFRPKSLSLLLILNIFFLTSPNLFARQPSIEDRCFEFLNKLNAKTPAEIETEEGAHNGSFIFPNEKKSYAFKDIVKGKKGALISVGTFRSLRLASFGDFEKVIL